MSDEAQLRREQMLAALEKTDSIAEALILAGVTRFDHENWLKRNPEYREEVEVLKLGQATRRALAKRLKAEEQKQTRNEAVMSAKYRSQTEFLNAAENATTIQEACDIAGIPRSRYENWQRKDTQFRRRWIPIRERMQQRHATSRQDVSLVYDPDRDTPEKKPFREWRPYYLGRNVLPHQEHVIDAWEDRTNRVVFVLGPTGMGKDTTAGDILLYEHCDDRQGLRSMWMMESAPFSRRRISQRIDPYLTDRKVYQMRPEGSDSVVPQGNLIDDYGPFKWKKGMVYTDGTPVEATTWTQNEIYLLGSVAPESDPNLWATGIGGAIYGSRINRAFLSDLFTRENQANPEIRQTQRDFVDGTLKSRLDGRGRALFIGTRVSGSDNYGYYLDKYIANARVISETSTIHSTYTKYSNGTAVVIIKAIGVDDEGNDVSFWEDRFPLHSYLELDGERHKVEDLSEAEYLELAEAGAEFIEGLYDLRDDNPELFATMQMQDPPQDYSGDFTDEVLNMPDDPTRTMGIAYPHEILVVGVDPARTAGAAYATWAVDRQEKTATLVDVFYGERLGISGIKKQLVMAPIAKWDPLWYCYETNREAAVLDDPTIQRVFKDAAVSVWGKHTGQERSNRSLINRGKTHIGVPAMGFYMRSQWIRWPAQTAEDRRAMEKVKQHFKNWDERELGVRTRSGSGGHRPDDIAMACWIGFVKALEILEGTKGGGIKTRMPVPPSVRRRWERVQQRIGGQHSDTVKPPRVTATNQEIVNMLIGGQDGDNN